MERVPCKLNNECKTKHQSSASEMALKEKPKDRVESITCHGGGHENGKEEAMTNSSVKDFKASALRYDFIESLILAQDERWRRA